MDLERKHETGENEASPPDPTYDTPELTRYGTVEELTLGLGGVGGVDAQSV